MLIRSIVAGLALGFGLSVSAGSAAAADNPGWGTVKGQVVLDAAVAKVPDRPKLDVNKDQGHCLKNGPILSEEWVLSKDRGVKNVFVWLAPEQTGAALPIHPALQAPPANQVVMDQPCCAFEPHCLAIRQGQQWLVKNSAPVAHNVRWGSQKNPGASVIVPAGQQQLIAGLVADRLPVTVACDIHPWMHAWVRVFDHPYYALTDENGNFEIKDAPAGKFRLIVWHEGAGWGEGGKTGKVIEIKSGANDLGKQSVKPAP
jgi:hypothetical protein